jgi:multicomponent Na+:H+ antiporter subunit C
MNNLIEIITEVIGKYNYWIAILLMMSGFYTVIVSGNLIKKLLGLGIFQTSVLIFFISLSKIKGGTAPILLDEKAAEAMQPVIYGNPLPHVLMLTAIVVGVATLSMGMALVVRINEAFGSIEEDDIHRVDEAF